jgi:hypothetical protein
VIIFSVESVSRSLFSDVAEENSSGSGFTNDLDSHDSFLIQLLIFFFDRNLIVVLPVSARLFTLIEASLAACDLVLGGLLSLDLLER